MKKKNRPIDVFSLTALLTELEQVLVGDGFSDTVRCTQIVSALADYSTLLAHKRYAGHRQHLENMQNAIARGQHTKAALHLKRLRKIVRPTSNDSPFKVKDRVWVNRYEHGWEVGPGTVVAVHGSPPEIVSYTVELDEGGNIYVSHTRDLSRN